MNQMNQNDNNNNSSVKNLENGSLVLNNDKEKNTGDVKINESKIIDENGSSLDKNINNVPSNKSNVKNSNIDSENNGSESESEENKSESDENESDENDIDVDENENDFKCLIVECNPNKKCYYKTSKYHFELECIDEKEINNDTTILDAVKKILSAKKVKIDNKKEKERIDKLVFYHLYYIPKFDCDKYKEINWLSIKGSNGNPLELKDVKELYINMRKNSKNEKYTFRKYLNEKYKLKIKNDDKSDIDNLNDNETALEYDKLNINGTGAWIIYLIHEKNFKKYMELWKSDDEKLEEERLNKLNMEKQKKLLLSKKENAKRHKKELLDKIKKNKIDSKHVKYDKKRKRDDDKNVPSKKSKVYKKIEDKE